MTEKTTAQTTKKMNKKMNKETTMAMDSTHNPLDLETLIIQKLTHIIKTHTSLQPSDEDGKFYGEIFADFRDKLDDCTIKDIFLSDNPYDRLFCVVNDGYFEYETDCYQEVIKTIKKHFDGMVCDGGGDSEPNKSLNFKTHKDFIHDWVYDHIYFEKPYDHYFNQSVLVNIIVNTGDLDHDYTLNKLFGCNSSQQDLGLGSGSEDAEKLVKEKSALVWLMKQQGYSTEVIADFVANGNTHGSQLLQSIYDECTNTSSCMNALTFLVSMTLREVLDLHEDTQRVGVLALEPVGGDEESDKGIYANGYITIHKNTTCGLVDFWNGAGSILEIKLERDVVLPLALIDSVQPDGCRGFGVMSVYGLCSSFWTEDAVKYTRTV